MEDLVMAALEGLMKAYLRSDPSKGFRSSSFAMWYAIAACQNLVHQQGTSVRLTTSAHAALRKVLSARDRLRRLKREPTLDELADEAGLSTDQVRSTLAAFRSVQALRIDDEDGGPGTITADRLGPTDDHQSAETKAMAASLRHLVATHGALSSQQRYVLQRRYIDEDTCTLTQIATELNCSRERVRRLETQALTILRHHLEPRPPAKETQERPLRGEASRPSSTCLPATSAVAA
jgi:RNA polymerase sigma factor (sigma-70 family)